MSEFKDPVVPDQQPTFPFMFNGDEFRVWAWLEDGTRDVYTLCLAKVVPQQGGGYGLNNVVSKSVSATLNTESKIKSFFNLVFLVEANTYLANLKDEEADMTFPSTGTQADMFNWFITKGIIFADDKLSLK